MTNILWNVFISEWGDWKFVKNKSVKINTSPPSPEVVFSFWLSPPLPYLSWLPWTYWNYGIKKHIINTTGSPLLLKKIIAYPPWCPPPISGLLVTPMMSRSNWVPAILLVIYTRWRHQLVLNTTFKYARFGTGNIYACIESERVQLCESTCSDSRWAGYSQFFYLFFRNKAL